MKGSVSSDCPWSRPAGAARGRFIPCALPALALLAALASAEQVEAEGRVVTISEVTIVGRVQKPIAAVDVSRIQPRLTLSELRQSFTDRIERALYRAPL
jgi:hypothetical protein